MNASPGRSDRSIRTGATMLPRAEETLTRSPSLTPSSAASALDSSSSSPRRRGDV